MVWQTRYQLVTGIWNPRENDWSWIVANDDLTIKEARAQIDEVIAEYFGLRRSDKITNEHRLTYDGPPWVLMEVRSKILERLGNPDKKVVFDENILELTPEMEMQRYDQERYQGR